MKINVSAVKDTFNKYSLNELAEVLGIHRSTISYYRSGRDFTKTKLETIVNSNFNE